MLELIIRKMPHHFKKTLTVSMQSFWERPFQEKLNTLGRWAARLKGCVYYRHIFGSFGNNSMLFKPIILGNPKYVHIGKDVSIRHGARIEVILSEANNRIPELRIGDNVNIEQNVHLVCHSRITIGRDVSITGNCAIVDVTHPYADVNNPEKIGKRVLDENSFVEIGDGCFLGFGSFVMPNVRIGRYCVVGAHSVVTRDVPDYSVVAGNPAKLTRRYNPETNRWCSPDELAEH